MQIIKHGDPTKMRQHKKPEPIHFICNTCGCEWDAYFGETCVLVNKVLKSWQSTCPEDGCDGFALVDMFSK